MTDSDQEGDFPEARSEFESIVHAFVRPPLDLVLERFERASREQDEQLESLRTYLKDRLAGSRKDVLDRLGDPQWPDDASLAGWMRTSREELREILEAHQNDHDCLGALLVQSILLGSEANKGISCLSDLLVTHTQALDLGLTETQQRFEKTFSAMQQQRTADVAIRQAAEQVALEQVDAGVSRLEAQVTGLQQQMSLEAEQASRHLSKKLNAGIAVIAVQAVILAGLVIALLT